MLLEGTIAKLIVKLNPKLYRKYTGRNKNNKQMVHVKLKRLFVGHYRLHYFSGGYCQIPL